MNTEFSRLFYNVGESFENIKPEFTSRIGIESRVCN
jgi:hypothetical protein